MIRRLRKKFMIAAVASVFIVLLVLISSINVLNYRSLVAEAEETLRILSENGGEFPRQMFREQDRPELPDPAVDPGLPPEDGVIFKQRGGNPELAYQTRYFAAWFAEDGSLSRINLDRLASLTEDSAEALAKTVFESGKLKGAYGDYRFSRTSSDGETLLLFLNCERELSTFRTFLYASIGISLAGIVAVLLLLRLFSERIVRPIAESYEKQRRFITDAGHELKTPISIIRADAEVLQTELDGESEWLDDINKQTHRLADLTADLIYLSKMEEENPVLQMQSFSLSELVEETAQSFQALAISTGKEFDYSAAPGLNVTGDEKALAKLVSILLDNAMKYSPEGGSVRLVLDRAGKNARLTVKNSAFPMEKGNADRLFDRFTREDSSRNSETGGFGLGLAIAKAVTEAHKGKIHAESEDGESLTVTAEFPTA